MAKPMPSLNERITTPVTETKMWWYYPTVSLQRWDKLPSILKMKRPSDTGVDPH